MLSADLTEMLMISNQFTITSRVGLFLYGA